MPPQSPRTRPPRSVELMRRDLANVLSCNRVSALPLVLLLRRPDRHDPCPPARRWGVQRVPDPRSRPYCSSTRIPDRLFRSSGMVPPLYVSSPVFYPDPFTPSPPPLQIGGGGVILPGSIAFCSRTRTRTARGSPQDRDPSALAHNSAASSAVLFASSESSPDHIHRRYPPRLASSSIARCPPCIHPPASRPHSAPSGSSVDIEADIPRTPRRSARARSSFIPYLSISCIVKTRSAPLQVLPLPGRAPGPDQTAWFGGGPPHAAPAPAPIALTQRHPVDTPRRRRLLRIEIPARRTR